MSMRLDDFRTAANGRGVELIPFSDLRTEATSIADDIQRRKSEAENYSVLGPQKGNILKEIKKYKDKIQREKKFMEDFKRDYPDADLSTFDSEISKDQTKMDEQNNKLREKNDQLAQAVDNTDRLLNLRGGLREWFSKALDKLSDVRSNPESYLGSGLSDDDKSNLQSYINDIESKIKSEQPGHQQAEDELRNGLANLKADLSRTE